MLGNILLKIKLANHFKTVIQGSAPVKIKILFFGFFINTIGQKPRSHIPQ